MADQPKATRRQHAFQAPRGTRDFYPADLFKRRWIEDAWRRAALCHGFDEIDGPRFEHADLYTVKSGEGILSELFSFTRAGGDTRFALRPEFTPTLARMVAARANSLPKPTKWFSVGPYFRAERPQRGRLREFLQWNVDLLGSADDDELTKAQQDAEVIACCVEMLKSAGLGPDKVRIKISDRRFLSKTLSLFGIPEHRHEEAFAHLDKWGKMDVDEWRQGAGKLGVPTIRLDELIEFMTRDVQVSKNVPIYSGPVIAKDPSSLFTKELGLLRHRLDECGVAEWCNYTPSIVRGLAYYTGMVFEVHETGGKERAIAGGGRYDHLVELFGGPTTPAVGFAMGDVVLANVLQDKGLLPSDAELRDRLGQRPDVFVISTGSEESESALAGVVAAMRGAGLHARHTYKTTRNIGKLIKEATSVGARFAVILDDDQTSALKNLDTGEQEEGVSIASIARRVKAAPAQGGQSC